MATIIIVYDTKYGQTQRIAEYIGEFVRGRGYTADVVHVGGVNATDNADAIVVLAPVFVGKHMDTIRRFVLQQHEALNRCASAFISVSGAAESTIPAERASAQKAASDFVARTPWHPQIVATAGGAIDYPRYNPFLRLFLKFIAKRNGGPTDTSRCHVLTDWSAVKRTTLDLLAKVDAKTTATTRQQPSRGMELR